MSNSSESRQSVDLSGLKFNSAGLIPAIVQDHVSKDVLMLAWMNEEALLLTLKSAKMTYWSRSRNSLWVKGETSGHFQTVKSAHLDCDGDTLLFLVEQQGVACHRGTATCFTCSNLTLS